MLCAHCSSSRRGGGMTAAGSTTGIARTVGGGGSGGVTVISGCHARPRHTMTTTNANATAAIGQATQTSIASPLLLPDRHPSRLVQRPSQGTHPLPFAAAFAAPVVRLRRRTHPAAGAAHAPGAPLEREPVGMGDGQH